MLLHQEAAVLGVALASIIGHLHSMFLGFRGGKGVATALGAALGVAPWIGLTLMGLWIGAVFLWKYSSGGTVRVRDVSVRVIAFPSLLALYRICLCRESADLGETQGQSRSSVERHGISNRTS